MSTQFFPLAGCEQNALEAQAALAGCSVRLFKSTLTPDPSTPLATYTAAIADFSGYTSQTITEWLDPQLAEGSGYLIASPNLQWLFADSPGTPTNVIGGTYLVDANGNLRFTIIFTDVIPMQVHGQGILFSINMFFPTGV